MSNYPHRSAVTDDGRVSAAIVVTIAGLLLTLIVFCAASTREMMAGTESSIIAVDRLLPSDVLLHVTVPDPTLISRRLSKSRVQRLLDDPELSPLRVQFEGHFQVFSREISDLTGLTPNELVNLPGPASVSIVPHEGLEPAVVTCLQLNRGDRRIQRIVDAARSQLRAEIVSESAADISGTSVVTLNLVSSDNEETSLTWFEREGLLVFSTQRAVAVSMLERWNGSTSAVLADDLTYLSVKARTSVDGRQPLVRWFVNPGGSVRTWASGNAALPDQAAPQQELIRKIFTTQAADDCLTGIGGTLDLATDRFDFVARTAIESRLPIVGLWEMLTFPPTHQQPARWVPSDAAFATWNLDFGRTSRALTDTVDSLAGEGTVEYSLFSFDAPFRAASGESLITEILKQLTGETTVVQFPDNGSLVISLGVHDPVRAGQLLDTTMQLPMFLFPNRAVNGAHVYEIPAQTLGFHSSSGVAIVGDQLICSSDLGQLERIVNNVPAEQPLVESPGYQKAIRWLPEQTSIFAFNQSERYIDLLVHLLQFGPEANLAEHTETSMRTHAMRAHRSPLCFYAVPDERGAQIVLYSLSAPTPLK